MKAPDLVLRCYAEKLDGQWQAFCLDLSLCSQAESLPKAQKKLEEMVCSYVVDAVIGEDKKHAYALLNRRAPARYWIKYYAIKVLNKFGALRNCVRVSFKEALPLSPNCRHA